MFKQNMIDQSAEIIINGGECTILKEFKSILKVFLKKRNNNFKFWIQTNGIKYEKLISKCVAMQNKVYNNIESGICISLDAGTRETYKKIKRVDEFNSVVNNIKRYRKDLKKYPKRIIIKYIIIPQVNDSKEEILQWIKLCKSLGVTLLQPSIDFCTKVQSAKDLDENLYDAYTFMKEEIEKNNLEVVKIQLIEEIIKNKSFDITKYTN